ncbi:hypothetical protein Tco_1054451 [Tanacetum coccineum]|uniref:Gag-Pol polyprotein n=1 Tax=Tanacetum coccineum TaxID=301880 RepID=A0ABQ5GX83_9ASTR
MIERKTFLVARNPNNNILTSYNVSSRKEKNIEYLYSKEDRPGRPLWAFCILARLHNITCLNELDFCLVSSSDRSFFVRVHLCDPNTERAKGNANGNNSNQIRCYNCKGLGYYARNYTAKPRKRGVAFLQTQLLIAEKEEAGIQLQAEEFDFMTAAGDLE